MRIISRQDVDKVIQMVDIIPLIEKAFADYTAGKTVVPLRTKISMEEYKGDILFMPAYLPESHGLGVKVVSVFPGNAAANKQTIHSVLMLNDEKTGEPIALMDAERLTALRTGAVSGVAAKYLSLENASVVTVFGAGIQAKTQLEAICCTRRISKIFVSSRSAERCGSFAREMSIKLGVEVLVCKDEAEALRSSDIIIAATTSHTPVFDGEHVRAGAFITAVGGYTPKMQEVPENLVAKACIVVDAYMAAMKEAGDIIIPMEKGILRRENINAELGEVVMGKYKRQSEKDIILFKSVGLAIQDMCIAPLIYKRALDMGLGVDVEL